MRFRRLSSEELTHLEKEFVEFLVSNTITADDWLQIKDHTPEKAEHLIEMFSDVVLEKVYSKVVLLEKRESKNLLFFKFDGDLIQMIGVSSDCKEVDFLAMKEEINFSKIKLNSFKTSRVVDKDTKADEVYKLIVSGCLMGNSELYKTLDAMIE